jgi:hypothetical protein
LCFREPLQKRKVFIRQRYRDRAHGRTLAMETVGFKNGGGCLEVRIRAWGILKRGCGRGRCRVALGGWDIRLPASLRAFAFDELRQ